MELSSLKEMKDLLAGLLACRQEGKLVIVSLCDRGRAQLDKLVQSGPDLISMLDQIIARGNIDDGYLHPVSTLGKWSGNGPKVEGTEHCWTNRNAANGSNFWSNQNAADGNYQPLIHEGWYQSLYRSCYSLFGSL